MASTSKSTLKAVATGIFLNCFICHPFSSMIIKFYWFAILRVYIFSMQVVYPETSFTCSSEYHTGQQIYCWVVNVLLECISGLGHPKETIHSWVQIRVTHLVNVQYFWAAPWCIFWVNIPKWTRCAINSHIMLVGAFLRIVLPGQCLYLLPSLATIMAQCINVFSCSHVGYFWHITFLG